MAIGKNIKLFRVNAGIKQKDLAQRIGIKESYMSSVESERKEPSLSLLKKIADELGIPVAMFFWDDVDSINDNTTEGKLKKLLIDLASFYKSVKTPDQQGNV